MKQTPAIPKEIWDTINEELDLHTFTWTFSVDGLEDTNHIYRKRSNWSHIEYAMSKILSMPKERRPVTVWKWIEFPYNKHQTLEARALAKSIGFDEFASVTSTRWRPYPKSTEDIEQYLFPKELELWKESMSDIHPRCLEHKNHNVFVSPDGYLRPCCYVNNSLDWDEFLMWVSENDLDIKDLELIGRGMDEIVKTPLWTTLKNS